jgi:hypothetical protein
MLRPLLLAVLLASSSQAPGQAPGVLHVRVVLVDAERGPTPVARHLLLVSDNPATAPPLGIVTAADGTASVKLRPGSYTVESDRPFVFDGKAWQWTRTVEISAGRDATLELTADNAEVGPVTPAMADVPTPPDDESRLLSRWQDSVVVLWAPTSRASGFLFDARGLVATSQRALGNAKSVEVQITPTVKVAARILAADPVRDVAILWVDPKATASLRPVPLECSQAARPLVEDGQEIFTIGAPLRGQKRLAGGTVTIETRAILADLDLEPGATGGPVFTADGVVAGIAGDADEIDQAGRGDSRVVPLADACAVVKVAAGAMRQAAPPGGTHLPVEPSRPFPVGALEDAVRRRAGSLSPYQASSSNFDIAFITPVMVHAEHGPDQAGRRDRGSPAGAPEPAQARARVLSDFGHWTDYVRDVPPVLLVRATPRMVEGFWAMVARGAAQTQGMSLPPMKRYKSGFWRMRAFCGTAEVTPIHPFELERRLPGGAAIREGLHVFDPGALGPHCGTVKLVLYSEGDPAKGDTRVVDPKVLRQVWQDFEPWRAADAGPGR